MDEECDDKDDTKRKSRNLSEKKRRDQFNTLVNDLSTLVSSSNRKMDKSTVLKSTIAFLKHHNEVTDRSKMFEIREDWKPPFLTNDEFTHLILESLDGFIIVFNSSGFIFYASESITSLLGYLPSDLLNLTIFDLTYEMEYDSLFSIFINPKSVIESLQTDISSSNQITFYVHLKRGGIEKVDANAYELVKFVGYFRNDSNLEGTSACSTSKQTSSPKSNLSSPQAELNKKLIFVGTGRIQTPQLIREMSAIDISMECNEFISNHSMEWKFTFLDDRAPPIIGYKPFEVLGTCGYDYYHFDDLDSIVACHEELKLKGEGKSCFYRFLTKGQQWIWLQSEFYVSYHQFNSKPDHVVCTHKVVSYAEVIRQTKFNAGKTSANNTSTACSKTESCVVNTNSLDRATNASISSSVLTTDIVASETPMCIASREDSALADILCDSSPLIDSSVIWSGTPSIGQLPTPKTSRPASSYGNISSTGISPTAKRKRYFSSNNRGNESDSTSISADSITSRNSLVTHISSSKPRNWTSNMHSKQYEQQQHQRQQVQQHMSFHQVARNRSPVAPTNANDGNSYSISLNQNQTTQNNISLIPHHHTTQIVPNSTCQFLQPAFPMRSPQLIPPALIDSPHYLTAIPVQPVIAPFSVAAIPNPADILPSAVVMTPSQSQLQDQLQRKHDELQKLIMQQQDELRIVSEQLLLARYALLQPMVQIPNNGCDSSASPSNRNVFTNMQSSHSHINPQQFNQYGMFGMSSDQTGSNSQNQQTLLPQDNNHTNQHQHIATTHQPYALGTTLHHQQQQHQLHHINSQVLSATSERQTPQEESSAVAELDSFGQEDIDAFLSLSPLQALDNRETRNINGNTNNHLGNTNQDVQPENITNSASNQFDITSRIAISSTAITNSNHNANNNNHADSDSANIAAVRAAEEDSILSYMQMTSESSSSLNFLNGTEPNCTSAVSSRENLKIIHLHNSNMHQSAQMQAQQQSQQSSTTGASAASSHQQVSSSTTNSFYATNSFGNMVNQQQLTSELAMLPYQLSQEQSQKLFDSQYDSGIK